MTENIEVKKLTEQEVVERLVNIYREVNFLQSDAKELLSEAKELFEDYQTLNAFAKAIASDKVGDIEQKYNKFLEVSEEFATLKYA